MSDSLTSPIDKGTEVDFSTPTRPRGLTGRAGLLESADAARLRLA